MWRNRVQILAQKYFHFSSVGLLNHLLSMYLAKYLALSWACCPSSAPRCLFYETFVCYVEMHHIEIPVTLHGDSNPQPLDSDECVLPLCCHLSLLSKLKGSLKHHAWRSRFVAMLTMTSPLVWTTIGHQYLWNGIKTHWMRFSKIYLFNSFPKFNPFCSRHESWSFLQVAPTLNNWGLSHSHENNLDVAELELVTS